MTAVEVIALVMEAIEKIAVGLERLAGCGIAGADRLEMGELAAAHDADHGAGQLAGLDVAAQRLTDAAQPRRGQAHALGLGAGKGGCGHGKPLGCCKRRSA